MCGLVGAVQFDEGGAPIKLNMTDALLRILNRGPDDGGVFSELGAHLGHRRLSIIDVSRAAQQPMYSSCGRFVIVFNGEVYNFAALRETLNPACGWRTESDTELVVEAYAKWGPSCLDKFHGMFAIVIWDRSERRLFIARDRLGVKPLYYTCSPGFVGFSSRPGALHALVPSLSKVLDRQAIRYYLESGYVPSPLSIYESIRKLEAGHYLLVDSKKVRDVTYWSLDKIDTDPAGTQRVEGDLLEELDELLDRSIRWRMVSSVPVGAFLSGGIDSSLVVSRMAKISAARVKTFTIGFAEAEFDESAIAAAVAVRNNTEHFSRKISSRDLIDLLPRFLREFDEPLFDHSAIAVMAVSRLACDHVKVVLSGDGGDEAFGGYHYYRAIANLSHLYKFPSAIRLSIGAVLRRCPGSLKMIGEVLGRHTVAQAFAYARSVIKSNGSILNPSLMRDTKSLGDMFTARAIEFSKSISSAEAAMRLDIAYTLPDDYLQKVDVASMAFSIEARDPLLDHSIMEWAARLATSWKLRQNTNKYILRCLAYRSMPRKLLEGPKRGFGLPINEWLRGDLRHWGWDLLNDSRAMHELELNSSRIILLWNQHQARKVQAGGILWSVLVLIAFYRIHVVGVEVNGLAIGCSP